MAKEIKTLDKKGTEYELCKDYADISNEIKELEKEKKLLSAKIMKKLKHHDVDAFKGDFGSISLTTRTTIKYLQDELVEACRPHGLVKAKEFVDEREFEAFLLENMELAEKFLHCQTSSVSEFLRVGK